MSYWEKVFAAFAAYAVIGAWWLFVYMVFVWTGSLMWMAAALLGPVLLAMPFVVATIPDTPFPKLPLTPPPWTPPKGSMKIINETLAREFDNAKH